VTVLPIPMDDGIVRCECGREMRPMVGRRPVMSGNWSLWWECLTGDHVSAAIPVPTEGVDSIGGVNRHGSSRVSDSQVAVSPEGSLHR
jgi:hypothetical protein